MRFVSSKAGMVVILFFSDVVVVRQKQEGKGVRMDVQCLNNLNNFALVFFVHTKSVPFAD